MKYRIGHGYDAHRLVNNRLLILGGVNIPHTQGLLGHSDADVLTHAIIDALLGAAGLADIGYYFPDSDEKYKNADSLNLLSEVFLLINKNYEFEIENIDSTIIAQSPRLSPYLEQMRSNIAKTLKMNFEDINVKATTEEGMGFTGSKEGIAAHAVCILKKSY